MLPQYPKFSALGLVWLSLHWASVVRAIVPIEFTWKPWSIWQYCFQRFYHKDRGYNLQSEQFKFCSINPNELADSSFDLNTCFVLRSSNCSMIQIHDIENFTTNIIRMDKHVQEVRIEQFSPRLKTIYSSIAYFSEQY